MAKVLSVKQPYATLICAGVKTVENRTWKTDYRGRLLIHASGDNMAWFDVNDMPERFVNAFLDLYEVNPLECPITASEKVKAMYALLGKMSKFYDIFGVTDDELGQILKQRVKEKGFFYRSQAIIGEAEVTDIVNNSTDEFAFPNNYHWLLKNPILYDKPIINVLGHLRLWNFDA